MAVPTYNLYYALDDKIWTNLAGGDELMQPLKMVMRQDATFVLRFTELGIVVEKTVSAWEVNVKTLANFGGDALIFTTSVTKTGTGTGTYFTFTPDCGSEELVEAMGMRKFLKCAMQIDFTISSVEDKTSALAIDITNDYAENSVPPTPVGTKFVRVYKDTDVLYDPNATDFYTANPPPGGGGSSTYAALRQATSGVQTAYAALADTNAARGVALLASLAAASAGQIINVGAGFADTQSLALAGGRIAYNFPPGSGVDYSGNAGAVFDDSATGINADMDVLIGGYGKFVANQNFPIFWVTRAGSTLTIEAGEIENTQSADTGQPYCIFGETGNIIAKFTSITSPQIPIYWWGGDGNVVAQTIVQTEDMTGTTRAAINGTTAIGNSKWYIDCPDIHAVAYGVYFESTHATNRLWVTGMRIYGGRCGILVSGTAGIFYGSFQKVEAATDGSANLAAITAYDATSTGGGATMHITTQKAEGGAIGVIALIDGINYVKVLDEVLDTGLTGIEAVLLAGGTNDLSINRLVRTTNWHCIEASGGTTRLSDSYISTGGFAGKSAIRGNSSATLVLRNVHLQVHAAADSIASSDASTFTVICEGKCTTNRDVGANVAIVGTLEVNASFT